MKRIQELNRMDPSRILGNLVLCLGVKEMPSRGGER